MDSTHLHLVLNHFPIVGTLIGTGVMAYGIFTASDSTKKAALWIWVLMALVAIPVFLTGEPAEERVEELIGVSETMIGQHEEAAEAAIWAMEILGAFSLLALIFGFRTPAIKKAMTIISLILSLVSFGLMARTGYLGGQIRHSEIRSGVTAQFGSESSNGEGENDYEKPDEGHDDN